MSVSPGYYYGGEGNENVSPGVTITIRLIRSFEFRNWKPLVVRNVNLDITTEGLAELVEIAIKNSTLPLPFKNFSFDTFKIEYQPHGLKTNDPLINTEDDDKLILKSCETLRSQDVQHETEISFFRLKEYKAYQKAKASKTE